MEHIIQAKGIRKNYIQGDIEVIALDIHELNIEQGKITAILGRSGSGKSTLLHALGGMDPPTQGQVLVKGVDLYNKKSNINQFRTKEIGFVFQEYNLIPELTVLENIRLPLDILNLKYDTEYENTIINMLELNHRLSFYPNQLSGGQKQRTAIARALCIKPAVVFADEPTGSIDQLSSSQLMDYIKQSNEAFGQTYVLATHDSDVASYAHIKIYLEDGRIR